MPNDITVVYYTANAIDEYFAANTQKQLLKAIGDLPLITVSKKPLDFGQNIVVNTPRHHLSIYRDALTGVKAANTKYVALTEDDVLYSPEHFKRRSSPGKFAYNLCTWAVFTWQEPPMFTAKASGRINLNALICERELFIEAMEERFAKWPDDTKTNTNIWAEPGKYEGHLGVKEREKEVFYANPPNIVFSHRTELSFAGLGTRKRVGEFRAIEIPYWGTASEVMKTYKS